MRDKAFDIAKTPKYDGYQRDLVSMVYNFFDKNTSVGTTTLVWSETLATRNKSAVRNEIVSNKELAEEFHKPIIRKFNKTNMHSSLIDNIWGADTQLISKFNKGFTFLLCVIDIYSKYA